MFRNYVETLLGAAVLAVALGFLAWAYGRSDAGDPGGYMLRAKFDRVDGLETGGDVRISGIKVGRVIAQELDPATFRAQVTFSVRNGIELPADSWRRSSAAACSAGSIFRWRPAATTASSRTAARSTSRSPRSISRI